MYTTVHAVANKHCMSDLRLNTHCSVIRNLGRMLEQLHSLVLVVPQEGSVMQEALLGDGLRIATKLDITKAVICVQVCHKIRHAQCSNLRACMPQNLTSPKQ